MKVQYHPYETTTLDAPLFHIILQSLLPTLGSVLVGIFRLRWLLTRPFEVRVLPKCLPTFGFPTIGHITVGDLLMALPLVICLFAGYNQTFVSPAVEDSGVTASYAIYWTFLTANKANSPVSFFLGIPFERMLPHHFMASYVTIILGGFHTYVAFVYSGGDGGDRALLNENQHRQLSGDGDSQYSLNGSNPNFFKFLLDGDNNFSGTILFLCLTLLVATSFFRFFRKCAFEIWLISHIILAVAVIIFCVLHEVVSILVVAIWWGVDLLARYIVMAGCRYPTSATIRKIEPDVCELTFKKPKGFIYNPGQFVQIAVREISPFQFHPISISSAPHEKVVTLHVRALGEWSHKLVALSEEEQEVGIFLEGPYGSLSIDIEDQHRYKYVLLVCGGIGVTHCQSVGKALQYQARLEGRELNQMRMIWAVRDLDMVRNMPPLADARLKKKRSKWCKDAKITREIFCTQSEPNVEDPLPKGIKLRTHRPDLDKILREMKEKAIDSGEMNIAVFGCGPDALIASLKEACREHSMSMAGCGGVFFDLHIEHFDF